MLEEEVGGKDEVDTGENGAAVEERVKDGDAKEAPSASPDEGHSAAKST